MFWYLSAILLIIAALFVLVPLWLRSRSLNYVGAALRKEANIALFHERRDELEADYTSGNIDQPSYDALVLELQQSLLTDVSLDDDATIAMSPRAKLETVNQPFFNLPYSYLCFSH